MTATATAVAVFMFMLMATATAVAVLVLVATATAVAVLVLVTTATAVAVLMLMTTAAAFATAAIATIVATTATAFAAKHIDIPLYLCIGGRARLEDFAAEMEVAASKEVVEVNHNGLLLHLNDDAVKAIAIGVGQGNDIARVDILFVEASVNGEHLFIEFDDVLLHIGAVRLVHTEIEVKLIALGQGDDVAFEGFEHGAKAGDKLEGVFGGSFLNEFVNALGVVGIEFVGKGDVLV